VAAAIEESEVVLVCMSQKYKDSANCRFEGEYAIQRKVNIIPILVQADYKPDGWYSIYYLFNFIF
jgi:hypothetical protein